MTMTIKLNEHEVAEAITTYLLDNYHTEVANNEVKTINFEDGQLVAIIEFGEQ